MSKPLKIYFCQFARRSMLFFLNRSFAPEIKVRSRGKSNWEISKSDVPSSAASMQPSYRLLPCNRLTDCFLATFLQIATLQPSYRCFLATFLQTAFSQNLLTDCFLATFSYLLCFPVTFLYRLLPCNLLSFWFPTTFSQTASKQP